MAERWLKSRLVALGGEGEKLRVREVLVFWYVNVVRERAWPRIGRVRLKLAKGGAVGDVCHVLICRVVTLIVSVCWPSLANFPAFLGYLPVPFLCWVIYPSLCRISRHLFIFRASSSLIRQLLLCLAYHSPPSFFLSMSSQKQAVSVLSVFVGVFGRSKHFIKLLLNLYSHTPFWFLEFACRIDLFSCPEDHLLLTDLNLQAARAQVVSPSTQRACWWPLVPRWASQHLDSLRLFQRLLWTESVRHHRQQQLMSNILSPKLSAASTRKQQFPEMCRSFPNLSVTSLGALWLTSRNALWSTAPSDLSLFWHLSFVWISSLSWSY